MIAVRTVSSLVRATHPGPTTAVTVVAALLAVDAGHDAVTIALVVAAVATGQLSVGWSNDLVDAARDRTVGRGDKPLATGELSPKVVRAAIAVAVPVCVVTSFALGTAAGLVHLVLVGLAWAYNLWLKRTAWSWLPFALAFGGLPVMVALALDPPELPPGWMMLVGACLGVGAHLANAAPDLDDDEVTGVRGLPHRWGRRGSLLAATAILTAASVVAVAGPAGPVPWWAWLGLAVVVGAAGLGVRGAGRAAFRAAMVIAVVDVIMLVGR